MISQKTKDGKASEHIWMCIWKWLSLLHSLKHCLHIMDLYYDLFCELLSIQFYYKLCNKCHIYEQLFFFMLPALHTIFKLLFTSNIRKTFPNKILQMKKNLYMKHAKIRHTILDKPCTFSSEMTNWSVRFDRLFMVMLTKLSCKL